MCQVSDDSEVLLPKSSQSFSLQKTCVKCDEKAVHAIGTNGTFCSPCFEKYFTHKFRASMGRNPFVRNNDKVLLAYSGGNNSSALLQLIKQGLDPCASRKLKFSPGLILIDERSIYPDENLQTQIEEVQEIMNESGFPHYTVKLEKILKINKSELDEKEDANAAEALLSLINSSSTLTSKLELVYRLRCQLLSYEASRLKYDHVFLGETSTRLAINILSNVALGRGAHLSQDTGFTDGNRYEDIGVRLLRPIRDISSKEIVMYNALHKVKTVFLPSMDTKKSSMSSIQSLTEGFVLGLVAGFPSTEMTVYRTSNKIKTAEKTNASKSSDTENIAPQKCALCFGNIDNLLPLNGASARGDIAFSEDLFKGCYGSPQSKTSTSAVHVTGNSTHNPDFDHIVLCYSCSTLQKEIAYSERELLASALPCASSISNGGKEISVSDKLKGVLLTD